MKKDVRRWALHYAVVALPPLAGLGGCLAPAAERVERDRAVGAEQSAALGVSVAEGLAVVRSLESPGGSSDAATRLLLWASAPSLEISLSAPEGAREQRVELEIDNAMPDGVLESLGAGVVVEEELSPVAPTHRRWRLSVAAGATGRLSLAATDASSEGSFRFALLSDIQEAIDEVGDIWARMNAEPGLRFLLGAGDLTRRGSAQELRRFQRELDALTIPYYTTLGNHELGESPPPWHEHFGRGNFHFDFRGVSFSMVDSASATIDPMVYEWLDGWMQAAGERTHVVAMHVPPVDPIGVRNGSFGSRNEAAKLLGRLAAGGVDLTLYGHIHSFYEFDNAGIEAYISGGGGAIPERFDGIGRHFMVIDIDPRDGVRSARTVRVDE